MKDSNKRIDKALRRNGITDCDGPMSRLMHSRWTAAILIGLCIAGVVLAWL